MKNKIFYRLGFLACILALTLTSCQGDYDEPVKTADEAGIGNSSISETNVVTIAQLKETYKSAITTSYSYKKVEEPMEIKGYVTGNDVQGNLYNELVIDDGTGAITIGVSQGGLYGLFPIGTEVLIELNGLSVGNYGLHPQIGTPYTSAKGQKSIGRMSRIMWNQHFRLTGKNQTIEPIPFNNSWKPASDGLTYSGKLVTMKNVSFKVPATMPTSPAIHCHRARSTSRVFSNATTILGNLSFAASTISRQSSKYTLLYI